MKRILLKAGFSIANCALFFAIILVPTISAAQMASENVGNKLTSGRLESLAILIIGIVSVVVGWRSMKRNRKTGAIIALILGLIGVIFSGIHLAKITGDFGTGAGKAGSIVALLAGLVGIVLAMASLYRIRNRKIN